MVELFFHMPLFAVKSSPSLRFGGGLLKMIPVSLNKHYRQSRRCKKTAALAKERLNCLVKMVRVFVIEFERMFNVL